ncbi:MAG TPA: M48 family metallopeptidase [Polyangiaceae bacterium]
MARRLRFFAFALLAFAASYVLVGFIADQVARRVSSETEATLFASAFAAMPAPTSEREHAGPARANAVLERLLAVVPVRSLPYRIVLWEGDDANAFAVPGGMIGVTPPLLEVVQSEVGLAFVVAHELGHHEARHTLRRLGRSLLVGLVVAAAGGSLPALAQSAIHAADNSYSREQEREADRFALNAVLRVYGEAGGALEFFEWLREERGEQPPLMGYFSTHPLTADRLKELQAELRALERGEKSVR